MGEIHYEDKVYCCSNTAKNEARKIALFDIIGYFFVLIYCSWATDFVKNDPETFRNMTLNQNASNLYTEFSFLLELNDEEQNFFFAWILIWCVFGMTLGTTLLFASEKEKLGLLKLWFAMTLLEMLLALFLVVLAMLYMERKVSVTFISIMVYLYKWYELWIVLRLTKELRSSSSVYTDDNHKPYPAFTVNGPTPISNESNSQSQSVFTIEGHTPHAQQHNDGRIRFMS